MSIGLSHWTATAFDAPAEAGERHALHVIDNEPAGPPEAIYEPPKRLRWLDTRPVPWLREFDRADFAADDWPPDWVAIAAIDEADPSRCWGRAVVGHDADPDSWHVPPRAVLPMLRSGEPVQLVWRHERYGEAGNLHGAPHLSALLRQLAGIASAADRAIAQDLRLANLTGKLYAGEIDIGEALASVEGYGRGEHNELAEIECRMHDFWRLGR